LGHETLLGYEPDGRSEAAMNARTRIVGSPDGAERHDLQT
jgi:hypothetical protein